MIKTIEDAQKEGIVSNAIYNADCVKLLRLVPDDSIDLIVTSPPYLNQKEYSQFADIHDYHSFIFRVLIECQRVLKPGSVLCWNIGDDRKLDLPSISSKTIGEVGALDKEGLRYLDTIIWAKKQWLGTRAVFMKTKNLYYPYFRHEHIFIYSKGKFNKKFDDEQKQYIRDNMPTNIWDFSVDTIGHHPAAFPVELPKRCVAAYTNRGDTVLDCFAGISSTALACKELGRNYIMIEQNKDYAELSHSRLQ